MNPRDNINRTPREAFHFALTFVGFFVAASAIVTLSIPAGITGLVLMLLGASYFLIKPWS